MRKVQKQSGSWLQQGAGTRVVGLREAWPIGGTGGGFALKERVECGLGGSGARMPDPDWALSIKKYIFYMFLFFLKKKIYIYMYTFSLFLSHPLLRSPQTTK